MSPRAYYYPPPVVLGGPYGGYGYYSLPVYHGSRIGVHLPGNGIGTGVLPDKRRQRLCSCQR